MEINKNFISHPFENLIKTRLKIVDENLARRISSQRIIKIFVPSNMV